MCPVTLFTTVVRYFLCPTSSVYTCTVNVCMCVCVVFVCVCVCVCGVSVCVSWLYVCVFS